jgi:hypothetical protein
VFFRNDLSIKKCLSLYMETEYSGFLFLRAILVGWRCLRDGVPILV